MGSENKKVKRYYIAIPKYDGLSKAECQKLWIKIMGVLKSIYGEGCYEVVNTFDRIDTCPDGIRNTKLYIISEELKIASRADKLVYINPTYYSMSSRSLYSMIIDGIVSTFSDRGQTIALDGSLLGLCSEEVEDNNKMINHIYKIKE